MTVQIPCPLCGGCERRSVAEQRLLDPAAQATGLDLPERKVEYLVCAVCQTVSMHPLPGQATLDAYYAGPALEVGGPAQEKVMDDLVAARVQVLRQITGLTAGRALEVGAGPGRLLDRLRDEMGLRVLGLEPSAEYAERPDVRRQALEEFDPTAADWPATSDLVVSCNVLEHVVACGSFLDRLCALVAPGGWLMIEVPSSERLARGEPCLYGQNIYPLHLHHFAAPGFAFALRSRGLITVFLSDHATGAYPSLVIVARRDDRGPARRFNAQLTHQQKASREAGVRLTELASEAGPVLIWGAGIDLHEVLTLMPDGLPEGVDVFDRNPDKQGHHLAGAPILDEATVRARRYGTVLAGSRHPALGASILADAAAWFPDAAHGWLIPPANQN